MNKFTHVEDYIEVIGGWRDPVTGKTLNHNTMWFSFTPIISLARYDVSVLDHMCDTVLNNKALTTKQGDLAVKIILKYARQLAQKGVDVSPVNDPQWRNKLRVIDYGKRMYIEDDAIMLEFPFSTALIDGLREFRKDSQGKGEWNKEKRRWEFALTEYNLVYLKTWAETEGFECDAETHRLNSIITRVEQQEYRIELDFVDGELTIKNAATSLIEYVEQHLSGFNINNLPKLIDQSSVLGYTVNADIAQAWLTEHGHAVDCIARNRELKVDLTAHHFADTVLPTVLKYAAATDRYPIVFYEPDLSSRVQQMLNAAVGAENVFVTKRNSKNDIPQDVKYIHTATPIKDIKIPLLVSAAGMMFGGDKSIMMQNADKAIYLAADVYTSKKDHKVPDFESQPNNS